MWLYELVLASNPQDTLKDLAEQGLERIQERQGDARSGCSTSAPTSPAASTLIQNPFLAQPSAGGFNAGLGSKTTQAKPPQHPGWTARRHSSVCHRREMAKEEAMDAVAEDVLTQSQAPRSSFKPILNRTT